MNIHWMQSIRSGGHTGAADKKANWGDEDNVKDVFNSLKTTYIDKGIPVYIGEMGCKPDD